MSMGKEPIALSAYRALVGQEIGVSRWFEIDQARVDRFADVTEDWQYIHVDPVAAASSPLGGTIAHGYLTLSLLTPMAFDVVPSVAGAEMLVNYGMNSLRFLSPVPVGSRICGRFQFRSLERRGDRQWRSEFGVSVEIEGASAPALVAEWVTLTMMPPQ